jgi:hypothetical protein
MSRTPGPVPVITESTAAIESAFLSAGQGLSLGLSAIRSLTDGLNALAADLDGGGTAAASRDLGRLSQTLRVIGERLPADGATLTDLLAENKRMGLRFGDLIDDMRMMVVVSRSARLEAVTSAEQRASLEAFSHTIDRQIGEVQRKIAACSTEHVQLTALLERAAQEHRAFDTTFHGRLAALAADLDEALGSIEARRDGGMAFMEDATKRSRSIAQAAGLALVSLQIGDNTRQRLEHVVVALEEAAAMDGGADPAGAVADLLRRIGEAQLRDTVTVFAGEAESILDAFALLGRETTSLVAAGRATYGHSVEGTASFITDLRTRFAAALDIVGACEATRRAVERVTGELRAMLDALDDTLTTLRSTSDELVVVAMNVGLKATRLGLRGRGLVAVAGELKRLASQISLHAEALLVAFQSVWRSADHFHGAEQDQGRSTALDQEASAILDALARADARIAEALGEVERTGRNFDEMVVGAARAFEAVVADTLRLVACADEIATTTRRAPPADAAWAAVAETVDGLLLPLYSMAQERDVHAAVLDSAAPDQGWDAEDRAA